MFAQLEFLQNTTMNDCLQDIVDVICGETDLNNLAAVVVGGSDIRTDLTTSPWELWDDVSGAHKVIRTQQSDSGEYKYIGFHHDSGPITNGYYSYSIMTDWDNSLHTGTNVYGPNYTYLNTGQRQQVGNFWYYIYADEFMIYVMPRSDFNVYGSSAGQNINNQSFFHGEITRTHPQMKVGDMPNWFIGVTSIFGGETNEQNRPCIFPRGRNYLGNEVSPWRTWGGVPSRGQINWSTFKYSPTTIGAIKSPEVLSGPIAFPIERLIAQGTAHYSLSILQGYDYAGDISERSDVWALPEGSVEILSQLIYKGKNYICMKAATDSSVTGTEAGFKVIIPYG